MTDETRAKVENRVLQIAKLADEICGEFSFCDDCPLGTSDEDGDFLCSVNEVCGLAIKIQKRNRKEPKCADGCIYGWNSRECKTCDYKDLPIDLDDDNHCDECCKPVFNECLTDKYNEDCPYDLGECCEDNLATNVGRICFDHNLPTNFAMAIIEIIQKERDRNEYLHIYREHIPAE